LLDHVVADLLCPLGEASLALDDGGLVCTVGHRFDIARQGYVNLLAGAAPAAADTAAMVEARARVQAAGYHQPITDALLATVADGLPDGVDGTVLELGAGTGAHLAQVLERTGAPGGLAIDLSKHAARQAARAHPRIGAVVADVWAGLPVRTGAIPLTLAVFAPRNPDELARVLRPGGLFVVVTPEPEHLAPLVDRLGLLTVDAGKPERLDRSLAAAMTPVARIRHRWTLPLGRADVAALVAMGPSAHHLGEEVLAAHLAGLPEQLEVTMAVTVSSYRRSD
jgi:23S rRNA (guanine745-N1)-methyltransferase